MRTGYDGMLYLFTKQTDSRHALSTKTNQGFGRINQVIIIKLLTVSETP
jgi:hypothetical protein